MTIRLQRGLGDAIYCYPIIKYLSQNLSKQIEIITNYPIIFEKLNIKITNNYKKKYDLFLRYTKNSRKNQYKELLDCAGNYFNLKLNLPLQLNWQYSLSESIKKLIEQKNINSKKLCIIKEPATAHMHKKSKRFSFTPNYIEMQDFINRNKENYFFISVGYDEIFKKRLYNIDLDLNNKLNVKDLISLCEQSDFIATQIGHLVVIAQSFNKPYKIFWPVKKDRYNKYTNIEKIKI